ncbi:MAG: 4Fe-4S dicluster domain-containing protein [Deltaproteobacteria bacterium]|nr:4Fe-4S dicluster domain-containing protein [Deltaproteobacteria bacterium]
MSAEDHEHHEHEDNYERAYGESAENAPEAVDDAPVAYGYWRSLREMEAGTATKSDGNELPPVPQVSDPLSRRNFFHLMGASMALAGVGACRYEKEEIVPLARRPEHQTPGQAQTYATAYDLGGVGHALLATSFDGRPIKLDGNTEHPFASGSIVPSSNATRHAGTSTFAQAAILHLYDPDRSTTPITKAGGSTIDAVKVALAELRKAGNIRVLSEGTSSPTVRELQRELTGKGVVWHEYESISWDNERLGTKLAFTRSVRPVAKLDRAETIVALDCDLFVEHPAALKYSRDFARSRRLGGTLGLGKMNRLYSIESVFSHTGAMADHRLGLRSELGLPFALALDAALGGGAAPTSAFLKEAKIKKFLDVLIEELQANRGKAVVVAGRRQPPEVHALVARINEKLDAVGKTLDYIEDPDLDRPSHLQSITALARDMQAGKVETLVIIGGNPVYDAPVDLDFAGALAKVRTTLHLSEYLDETSQKCTWHVPKAHFLEAWGDCRTWDGTVTIAQPLIAPLFGGLSSIQLLALLNESDRPADELIQKAHTTLNATGNWKQHVHDGFVAPAPPQPGTFAVGALPPPPLTATQQGASLLDKGVEVTFHYSPFSYDGRFANNAWLQETPDFLTKVVWDNYALVGPETAKRLGIENDQMITVKVGDREVELPCHTIPGQARSSIALVLGGGRTAAGRVGGGGTENAHSVGWNTNKVRMSTGFEIAMATSVTAGSGYTLASTQEHWDIRTGLKPSITQEGIAQRLPELIKEVTSVELATNKTWMAEPHQGYWDDQHVNDPSKRRGFSLFREKEYTGHKWGMATDLSTCTGCNSCMVACQNENNVPVVGRKEVMQNREMHWIRIDRYFGGTPDEPQVFHQPLTCQQCENAPCEQVCPVGATIHTDEGLNDQAYNRCIGTRYCANNCPYKVRRFNFLDWNKEWREARNKLRRLLFNPEVTVRMRGVMEKCTFCVQRIQNAKIHAKAVRRSERPGEVDAPLPDGDIVTACQAACPTEAIIFGDLADPNSRVSRLHADQRTYDLLPETYTKPRNKFLARVKNPNPKLTPPKAKAEAKGGH